MRDDHDRRPTSRPVLAEARRREAINLRWLVGLLVALTVYFGVLNLLVLLRMQPRPFRLELESSHYALTMPGTRLLLVWDPLDGAQTPADQSTRPLVRVGSVDMTPVAPESLSTAQGVPVQGPTDVAVVFQPRTTVGRHEGKLVLALPGVAAADWPTCPISVEFSGNPWRVWFILRTWLVVLIVLAAAVHGLCLMLFPAPSGHLLVHRSLSSVTPHATSAVQKSVTLTLRPSARLFPWQRASLSLTTLLEQGGAGALNCPEGTLWFTAPRTAPVLLVADGSDGTLKRRELSREKPDPARLNPVLASEDMTPDREYLFFDTLSQTWVSFHWSPHGESEWPVAPEGFARIAPWPGHAQHT